MVDDGLNEMGEETFFKKKAFFPQTPIFKEIAKRGFVFLLFSCSVVNDLVIKQKRTHEVSFFFLVTHPGIEPEFPA